VVSGLIIELCIPCLEEYSLLLQKVVAGVGQIWNLDLDKFFELSLVVMKAFYKKRWIRQLSSQIISFRRG